MRLTKDTTSNDPVSSHKPITEWLEKKTGRLLVEGSVSHTYKCCVCGQSPWFGKAKAHHGGQCPLLATFNRVRKGANLRPIVPTRNRIVASLQREPIKVETVAKDAEKGLKELRGELAAAIKRIVVLEKKAGIKRNAETQGQQSGTTPKKQKKDGDAKGKGKSENNAQNPKPSGSGQGKKADKGKGKAT